MDDPTNNTISAAALGMTTGDPKAVEGATAPYAVVPKSADLVSLERLLDAPQRKRADITFAADSSFIAYVNAHTLPSTALFVDPERHRALSVIDYHGVGADGAPQWCEHRAAFVPAKDPDWLAWLDNDGVKMTQLDFATFIEDHLPNIVDPPAAEVLEMVQLLEATSSVEFASGERLKDGSRRFVYKEEIKGTVGESKVAVPDAFTLGLAVFRMGDVVKMTAKLRYRLAAGKLALFYHLDRPQDVADEAFGRMVDGIAVETKITPLPAVVEHLASRKGGPGL